MVRLTHHSARIPISPVETHPVEPARTTLAEQLEQLPGLGPTLFAQTPLAQDVRATLSGAETQIKGAIHAANGFAAGTVKPGQLISRLRTVENELKSGTIAAFVHDLTPAERWARGLDLGRSLRMLSQAVGHGIDGLSGNLKANVESIFANIQAALDGSADVLPSVRLPPPRPKNDVVEWNRRF